MLIMIDNYDSFTYNLVQYFGDLGHDCTVFRNDELSVDSLLEKKPSGFVISPGPCDPSTAGICLDLTKAVLDSNIPLLGVCLGHQTIGQACGGNIVRDDPPMHGKTSEITHEGKSVFQNIPSPYTVTRYHSLVIERDTCPDVLDITAQTHDGIIMGISHKEKPIHGIQFHPESIATQHGHALLKNFCEML